MRYLLLISFVSAAMPLQAQQNPATGDVVATLDAAESFRAGTSLFWSPVGQAAWDQLRAYHGVKDIQLKPHTPVADVLNAFRWEADKTLPDGTVVFGGDDSENFREKIRAELRQKIGANAAAVIDAYKPPGPVDENTVRLHSTLMVSCISHSPRFPVSFKTWGAGFQLSGGSKPVVEGFGCQGDDAAAHADAVRVVADDMEGTFLLALACHSGEKARSEFMLVGMNPKLTNLAEGIEWMKQSLKKPLPADQAVKRGNASWRYHHRLTAADHFWMPKLKTTLSCEFGELTGKEYLETQFPNGARTFWRIGQVQQLLILRMNETGVMTQAVFKVPADFLSTAGAGPSGTGPPDPIKLPFLPRSFLLNRPFIVALWMKGAEWPYLACWVDSESVLAKR